MRIAGTKEVGGLLVAAAAAVAAVAAEVGAEMALDA